MATQVKTKPVQDTIPKVGNELAVGEDLDFQHRWWRFERVVWILFTIILALDLLGVFGRGPLAHGKMSTNDGAMNIEYERIVRFKTPSIITLHFGPAAVRDGKIQLWVSQTIVKGLGNQRIVPQPASSSIVQDGILYTWTASERPDSAEFALEPSTVGMEHFQLKLPAVGDELGGRTFIMP